MRKLLSVLFAFLLIGSLAGVAVSHQGSYNPQTTDGGAYISVPVFNNSGATLDPGSVVVWDIDASTGTNDMYVTTTTTANTGLVAGVIWPAQVLNQTSGSLVIWGLAECDVADPGAQGSGLLCTSGTAGEGLGCSTAADEAQAYAITNAVIASGAQGSCFVKTQ